MMKYLQKLGEAIMPPVAVLPVTVIMMGTGHAMCPAIVRDGDVTDIVQIIGFALTKIGSAVIDKLPMLFIVGVTAGLSKDQHDVAGLADLVILLTATTVPNSRIVATMMNVGEAPLTLFKIDNAPIGIIFGTIASIHYNKFSSAQLPTALAFFPGKCCVSTATFFAMVIEPAILYSVRSMLFNALVRVGERIMEPGPIGVGLYASADRLLTPTGLHHALNAAFWFDIAGIADIDKFWGFTEGGIKGVTGICQAGSFPVMVFGLPVVAFATYQTAKPEKKQYVVGIPVVGAVAFLIFGVTGPLELSFTFLAPGLYLVRAVLIGISVAVAVTFHWTAGFCSSAGITDFILDYRLSITNRSFILLVQGTIFVVIYYVVLCVVIAKLNPPISGYEKKDLDTEMAAVLANDNFIKIAAIALEGLGGERNVALLDNCMTRPRLEIKDYILVGEKKVKSAGVVGVMRLSEASVQAIVGTKVQFAADGM